VRPFYSSSANNKLFLDNYFENITFSFVFIFLGFTFGGKLSIEMFNGSLKEVFYYSICIFSYFEARLLKPLELFFYWVN